MPDDIIKHIDFVAAYLSNCRPPINASTAESASAIAAWNEIVKHLKSIEDKPKE